MILLFNLLYSILLLISTMFMYSNLTELNAPIGYSKNPLIIKSNFDFKSSKLNNKIVKDNTGFLLVSLPIEIKLMIINLLSQYDVHNLLQTCKSLYDLSIIRLYQNIIIDENYNRFSNEKEYNMMFNLPCTYINNQYSFKRFINTINDAPRGKFTIKKFQVYNLPKSLNIYQYYSDLSTFFSKFDNLNDLIWLNDASFNLSWLEILPHKEKLIKLSLHLKDIPQQFPYFPNLLKFQFEPFKLKFLIPISKLNNNLTSLTLSKDKVTNCLLPNCYDLSIVRRGNDLNAIHTKYYDIELKSINKLVKNIDYMNNLSKLSLNNILVTESDAKLLSNSINISKLTDLILTNISEYQIVNYENEQNYSSFLLSLSPYLENIENLSLDYRQLNIDSVPQFLPQLNKQKLKSLDLVIRLNSTKNIGDGYEFYNQYGSIILDFENLTKLSIEMRREFDNAADASNFHTLTTFPEDLEFISQLYKLSKLSSLRINPSDNVDNLMTTIPKIKNLKILDVFGNKAGGSPNLGLGMVHPSIYDEWFKVQHIALAYCQQNCDLEYIRIGDCIFECGKSVVNPRKGLDGWFSSKVRV